MSDALAPIAGKLAKFIRMLSSDQDGDVIAAAHAIMRALRGAGADIHALAGRIEKPNGRLSEMEMKRLYNAGYHDGMRAAEDKKFGLGDFHNIDGTLDWHEISLFCQRRSDRLCEKERTFINDMAAGTVWGREPSEKQIKWLKSLFYKLGGMP